MDIDSDDNVGSGDEDENIACSCCEDAPRLKRVELNRCTGCGLLVCENHTRRLADFRGLDSKNYTWCPTCFDRTNKRIQEEAAARGGYRLFVA